MENYSSLKQKINILVHPDKLYHLKVYFINQIQKDNNIEICSTSMDILEVLYLSVLIHMAYS